LDWKNNEARKFLSDALLLLFAFLFTVYGAGAEAQEPKKIPRIGVLVTSSHFTVGYDTFRQALRELGYIEGQNMAIEYRRTQWKASQAAAQQLNPQLHSMEIDTAEDLENVFREAVLWTHHSYCTRNSKPFTGLPCPPVPADGN
jgi:hypothetical protein